MTEPHDFDIIRVGEKVVKVNGYLWPGEVRSFFWTRKGELRYVVECTVPEVAGALHIFAPAQIKRADD